MAFDYKFPLAANDPNCQSSFVRGFVLRTRFPLTMEAR